MKAVQNSKIKLLVKLRLASEAMTSQWHTSKQEIECQRCGRASVTVLGYKVFLSSGQEKKAKLQAKPGQLQMWWLPSAEAVVRSSAGTAVEQGHLRAENGVWAWKSRIEILPVGGERSWCWKPLLVPPNAEVAKGLSSRGPSCPYSSTVTHRHFWEALSDSDTGHQKSGTQAKWQAGSWSGNLGMLQHQLAMTSETVK